MSDIRNCALGFKCDANFDDMVPTSFDGVRFCDTCEKTVHLCTTPAQLADALRQNWCVALGDQLSSKVSLEPISPSIIVGRFEFPVATWKEAAGQHPIFAAPAGEISAHDLAERSPLAILGYKVGQKGLRKARRRQFLDAFIVAELPLPFAPDYLAEWGAPGSVTRQERTESHLRWLASNRSKRTDVAADDTSIREWLEDADYVSKLTRPS